MKRHQLGNITTRQTHGPFGFPRPRSRRSSASNECRRHSGIARCKVPDGSKEFVNQRWQDYTGIPADEARGRDGGCSP
jgi:hypothetical protein